MASDDSQIYVAQKVRALKAELEAALDDLICIPLVCQVTVSTLTALAATKNLSGYDLKVVGVTFSKDRHTGSYTAQGDIYAGGVSILSSPVTVTNAGTVYTASIATTTIVKNAEIALYAKYTGGNESAILSAHIWAKRKRG